MTEFELFDEKDFSSHEKELELLYLAIDEMSHRGAKKYYFNNEGPAEYMPVVSASIKQENNEDFGVRLYCIWLSQSVVILMNGGIKTKLKPEDCPNVSVHFSRALKIARLIYKEIEIQGLNLNNSELEDLELDL
ncbi:hypothetical protein SAMN05428988_1259 [Chitinophaga sp. YR573]|nr:hypothetical protein SAMN05428988_1259 [Chitinophaga sp. YR573]